MTLRAREGHGPGAHETELFWRFWAPQDPGSHLFLVHGLGEHSGRYREVAEWLGERGTSVFSFDLRGHGRSQGPRGDIFSFQDFIDDLLSMEEAFSRILAEEGMSGDPRFILGHSLGGLITLSRLQGSTLPAGGYRGAILSAPWLGTPMPSWLRALARGLGRVAPGVSLPTGLRAAKLTRDPEKVREWQEDPLVHPRLTGRLFREVERVQKVCRRQSGRLQGLPVLFLVPEGDPVVRGASTLEFARGIDDDAHRVEILRERNHEALNDLGRGEVFGLVESWIRGLVPGPSNQTPGYEDPGR